MIEGQGSIRSGVGNCSAFYIVCEKNRWRNCIYHDIIDVFDESETLNFTKRVIVMNHIELAKKYFEQKYHCSQAVLAAFAEELGLTEEQALKLGGCFGGGICKGEVCGACAGALMALGMKFGQSDIEDLESRKKTNDITVEFLDLFKAENGSYLCRELLGCDLSTDEGKKYAMDKQLFVEFCPKMVESATLIAEKLLKC